MNRTATPRLTPTRLLATLAATLPLACLTAAPAAAQVVISQIYGGNGSTYASDYVELFNRGSAAVDVTGWSIQYGSATGTGNFAGNGISTLSGSIGAGRYLLVKLGPASTTGNAVPADIAGNTGTNLSSANGKVVLVNTSNGLACNGGSTSCSPFASQIVDLVGYGTANYFEGAAAPALTASTALFRAAAGCTDTGNNSADFTVAAPLPRNSATAAVTCATTGGGTGGGTGGDTGATTRAIYEIQGSGTSSPFVGQKVSTSGVVTKVNNNGFFIQDLQGDGNDATSDGLFVFATPSSFPAVAVGNLVTVSGTVAEFNVGAASNADTLAHTVTELNAVTAVSLVGSGYSITPKLITLPEAVDGDLERYEGMLVTINGPLTVQQNYFQARYGQLTLAAGGRLETPTNRYRPGSAQAQALADENARRRILLDDGSSLQNPNPTPWLFADGVPRAGDVVNSVTGVIDYGLATASNTGFGDYKIHPVVAPQFAIGNPRTATPPAVPGNLKVGSFNVLNFFTTFTDGTTVDGLSGQGCSLGGAVSASNCRGADSAAEFVRQRTKIVEAIRRLDADAVGLMEMQNNGNFAVNHLVSSLNAVMGAGTYASVALPAAGTGTDAIRVAMIYKPARLSPVGAPLSDTDSVNSRPPLAQTFAALNGERFTLVVNHLKSKGSCPASGDSDYTGNFDSGDGQGCWNAKRVDQANRLRSWVASLQAASGSTDVLLVGDFNAYGMENPITTLTDSGWVDQIGRYTPAGGIGYSYVFDGAAGRLDHAIASSTLSAKVYGTTHWHINADESLMYDYNVEFRAPATCNGASCPPDLYSANPYRASDHDPVLVGLGLFKTLVGTSGRDTLVGTPGDDILVGGAGADTLTGGAGADVFVYTSMRDAGDLITDFTPGEDRIDLRSLLASIGQAGATALANGVVTLLASGSDTLLQIDVDGASGATAARTLLTLRNVSPASIVASRDLILQ